MQRYLNLGQESFYIFSSFQSLVQEKHIKSKHFKSVFTFEELEWGLNWLREEYNIPYFIEIKKPVGGQGIILINKEYHKVLRSQFKIVK